MKRPSLRSWASQALVAAVAVGVVVAAPLAARNQAPADGVVISGARSLSDQVSVSYKALDSQRTTDVHLLAFNDLHGNLEAASLNIYGKFAGGAAYLAKAVKDRQALYRRPLPVGQRHDHQRLPGGGLPVPVRQRGGRRHRQDAVPRLRHQDVQDRRWCARPEGGLHRRGAGGHADDRHPHRGGRSDLPGRGGRRQPGRAAVAAGGRPDVRAGDPRGRLPGRHQRPQRLSGQPGGQPDRRHRQPARPGDQGDHLGPHHAEYRCTVTTKGITRLITSASSFGRILSDITLTLDTTGRLVRSSADNVIVENALNAPGPGVSRVADPSREDPEVQAVVNQYVTASAPLANQVIGSIQGDLTRTGSPGGESTLGDVIADAQLAATQPDNLGGAKLAFMNPGGIRADLLVNQISSGGEAPGQVTYGEAFTVQPFGNSLVTKTMTGDMLRRLLQQQFPNCGGQTTKRIL